MKIVIAGGTGFIGRKIIQSLNKKDFTIFVLTRNIKKYQGSFPDNIKIIDWNTINPKLLHDVKILIKLNGEKVDQLWTKSVKRKILNSRIDSTKMLLDFCLKNEIIPQKLINASAVGIYAQDDARYNFSVDENSKVGNTFLSKVCIENERSTDIFSVFENINIIQLRIGVVLRKKIVNLLSLNLFFSIPVPGNKNNYFPWVHVDDIVGFTNHAIKNNLQGAFNLIGPDLTTHKEFFTSIIRYKRSIIPWVIFLPSFVTKFLLGQMSEMFLYGPKTKPVRTLRSNYQFKYPNIKDCLSNLTE